MLAIRLLRIGKKHSSDFRMVVTDKKNPPRGGRFLEVLGFYNPKLKKQNFKEERIKHWIKRGAKPSVTCHNLLVRAGIINDAKIKIKISPKKKEKQAGVKESFSAKATEGKGEKIEEIKKEPEPPIAKVSEGKEKSEERKPEDKSKKEEGPNEEKSKEEKEEKKEEKKEEEKKEKGEKTEEKVVGAQ